MDSAYTGALNFKKFLSEKISSFHLIKMTYYIAPELLFQSNLPTNFSFVYGAMIIITTY